MLTAVDDWPEVSSTETPKARKVHRCTECDREILPGETYRRDFMVFMGEAETHKFCSDCDALMARFFAAMPKEERGCMTFEIGGLRSAVIELRDEYGATVDGFEYPEPVET